MLNFCLDHFMAIGIILQLLIFLVLPLVIKEIKFQRKLNREKPVEIDELFANNAKQTS
jgi:hypothetical protein